MNRTPWPFPWALVVLAACDADPASPDSSPDPNPDRGLAAFQASCASCHASGDGFDLAHFGFEEDDIVRRGVAHVSRATALDIAAHVERLEGSRRSRFARPFQPESNTAPGDGAFWRSVFGTEDWPDDLTVADLRALDLRDVAPPIAFPRWSSESDQGDWMPELPLPASVLEAEGGAVAAALAAYGADATEENLLVAVRAFRHVVAYAGGVLEGPVCAGSAGAHARPEVCFEARRWMSSLTAMHYLRRDEEREIPYEVAELWWDTGEAAVSIALENGYVKRREAAAWLYMSSIFVPDGFPGPTSGLVEEAGYMTQFLQTLGLSRMALLVTLRRMVSDGPLHEARPLQAYRGATLVAVRAPREWLADAVEFAMTFLLEEQAAGRRPAPEDVEEAGWDLDNCLFALEERGGTGDPERNAAIRDLIEQVRAGLTD